MPVRSSPDAEQIPPDAASGRVRFSKVPERDGFRSRRFFARSAEFSQLPGAARKIPAARFSSAVLPVLPPEALSRPSGAGMPSDAETPSGAETPSDDLLLPVFAADFFRFRSLDFLPFVSLPSAPPTIYCLSGNL